MKTIKWALIMSSLLLILTSACGEDESPFPRQPMSASGITDSSGEIQLDLGSHLIKVTTVTESGNPVGSMNVSAYLLENFLAVFASGNDTYYPNYSYYPYESLPGTEEIFYLPRPAAPQSPMTIESEFDIVMVNIDRDIYSFYEESEITESVYADNWITMDSRTGTLEDIYNLTDTIGWEGGIFIHISENVAQLTNPEVQTVSLQMDRIADYVTFSVLVGLEFHIFDQDTLYFHTITHNYNDEVIPLIYIDAIGLVPGGFFAQFTLTWDQDPSDLDSHLWTPMIEGSEWHIAYYREGAVDEAPYAFLDVDDVTSYGPEHIVITQNFDGTYAYAVHHYAGSGDIPSSGAVVAVLKPDRSVVKFTPPQVTAQTDWYWYVCDIDGTTGVVTGIDRIAADPPRPDLLIESMPGKN